MTRSSTTMTSTVRAEPRVFRPVSDFVTEFYYEYSVESRNQDSPGLSSESLN
jgi:hypothetical protein